MGSVVVYAISQYNSCRLLNSDGLAHNWVWIRFYTSFPRHNPSNVKARHSPAAWAAGLNV